MKGTIFMVDTKEKIAHIEIRLNEHNEEAVMEAFQDNPEVEVKI